LDAIESKMGTNDNVWAGMYQLIIGYDGEVYNVAEEVLANNPEDRDRVLKMMDDIENKFNSVIVSEIGKLEDFLKSRKISVLEIPE